MVAYLAVVAGLVLIAIITRLLQHRRPTGPVWGFFLAVFLAGGAALITQSSVTAAAMAQHHLDPFPQATFLTGSLLSLVAAYCVVCMLAYTLESRRDARRRARRLTVLLLTCAATMTALLLWVHPRPVADVLADYGHDPRIMAFRLLEVGYIGALAGEYLLLHHRYQQSRTPRLRVRISLWFVMVGATVALIFCAWNALRAVLEAADAAGTIPWNTVSDILSPACLAPMAIGAACAVWASPVVRLAAPQLTRYYLRALRPLWQRLRPVGDQWILFPHPAPHAADTDPDPGVPDPGLRLYRMIIEIRDWQFRLRPYVHPQLRHWAADLTHAHRLRPRERDTVIEAAELASALQALHAGQRYGTPDSNLTVPTLVAANQLYEARALRQVEHAIQHHPLVTHLCHRARTDTPHNATTALPQENSQTATTPRPATS